MSCLRSSGQASHPIKSKTSETLCFSQAPPSPRSGPPLRYPDLYVLPALTQAFRQEGHHILVVIQQLSHQLAVSGLIRLVLDLQATES